MADKRQRRKRRQTERRAAREGVAERYARGREKDEEVRQSLEPLEPGERPTAVTVGAIAAAVIALANLAAMIVRFDPDSPNKSALTLVGFVILVVVAVGMWRARYWAVLGLQTVLALGILSGMLALITADTVLYAVLLVALVVSAGTLFWYLVRAMARIQMPERPGASR